MIYILHKKQKCFKGAGVYYNKLKKLNKYTKMELVNNLLERRTDENTDYI